MSEKLYEFHTHYSKNPTGVKMIDQAGMLDPSQRGPMSFEIGVRGFKQFHLPEKIYFLHRKRWGRKPLDFEQFGTTWLISDRCKAFFDDLCPSSMDFVPGSLAFDDRSDDQKVWLADATRILDALDEGSSDVKIVGYNRQYFFGEHKEMYFFREMIGGEHLFRMKHAEGVTICDASFRAEFKLRKLKDASFTELGGKVPRKSPAIA